MTEQSMTPEQRSQTQAAREYVGRLMNEPTAAHPFTVTSD